MPSIAREEWLPKLKVEQLKAKTLLEIHIAAQKVSVTRSLL